MDTNIFEFIIVGGSSKPSIYSIQVLTFYTHSRTRGMRTSSITSEKREKATRFATRSRWPK